jgi:hypothetical protein
MNKYRKNRVIPATKMLLLAGVLAGSICASQAGAQSATPAGQPAAPSQHAHSDFLPMRAKMYYQGAWGVDSFRVKYTESGEIIRFSYRVVDPEKAAALNDKKSEPALNDPRSGVSLVVPEMPNVGKMRQTSTPKEGMTYWMAFSNVGRRVKRGDRVDVVIGKFRVTGLEVE